MSAVVKRYAAEEASDAVRQAGPLVTSELTRVEVVSAIRRKSRDDQIARRHADALIAAFEHDLADTAGPLPGPFVVIRLRTDILDEAVTLLDRWPLKAADALQLATAVVTRRLAPELTTVLCLDRQLAAAFRADNFIVRANVGGE